MAEYKGADPISVNEFEKLTVNWQRCRSDDLPDLFYGYDAGEMQAERLATYFMDTKTMERFAALITELEAKDEPYSLLVHLGLRKGYRKRQTAKSPHFELLLQIQTANTEYGENVWRLWWEADPSFPVQPKESVLSDRDAIPGAAAFLFVHSWLETKHADLGDPFEANAYHLGRRVKAYRFNREEGQQIAAKIKDAVATGDGLLCVHLGKGISVSTHPFSFRPVLEVTTNSFVLNGRVRIEGDDGDGSYFDYSLPIPPN